MLFYPIHHRHDPASPDLSPVLGGKGAGLAIMAGELGLPVPAGFTLTTEACRHFLSDGWSSKLEEALRQGIAGIERDTGRRFGESAEPLLVSVRSGAPVSMPGMLDTILNVGLTQKTQPALAHVLGDEAAEECRKGLEAGYLASVGAPSPDDAWAQLRGATLSVFQSANSKRAIAFRRRQELPNDPVTAINIQAMVFGNRDGESATGVFFSRDPATGAHRLYGDVLFRAQGEDVVSGRRQTERIETLADRLPDVARSLVEAAQQLELRFKDLCEIEFTVENGELWLLQVRVGKRSPRAALHIALDLAEDPNFPVDRREAIERVVQVLADPPRLVEIAQPDDRAPEPPLAQGLGVSPGIASGEIATNIEAVKTCRASNRPVILIRPETSPEDVEAMALADGLITAHGGLASHAAVIARSWGTPAVVGVEALSIDDRGIVLAGQRFESGEQLSLDGATGAVYAGAVQTLESIVPEATQLLEWARELGIPLEASVSDPVLTNLGNDATPARIPRDEAATADDAIAILGIKGFAAQDMLTAAMCSTPEASESVVAELLSAGLATSRSPHFVGLTEEGALRSTRLLAADRDSLGAEKADRALNEFQALDLRTKEAVTDWQLRTIGGELVPNDHTDRSWDEGVFERLGMLLEEVSDWLGELAEDLPRLRRYVRRLRGALDSAQSGDNPFIASPRVDSFHGVWFELHEDLIRLAGRTRAQEVEAGRAG
jgi:pyruvate, orthophosphate dikinase